MAQDACSMLRGIFPPELLDHFIQHHFHKFPWAIRSGGECIASLCDPDRLLSWAVTPRADALLARQGARIDADTDCPERIRRAIDQGCTLVVRHVERLDHRIASLACEFARLFGGPIDVQAYWTPTGQFGFCWHYDAEDVFVVQVEGTKQYALRKNTVHPWPTPNSMPADLRYEREIMPLMRCSLERGNLLYIPAGYWHKATAQKESITLSIGVMSPTRLDLLSFLKDRLASRLEWRERLPMIGAANRVDDTILRERLNELVQEAAVDLPKALADEDFVAEWLNWLRSATNQPVEPPPSPRTRPEVPG